MARLFENVSQGNWFRKVKSFKSSTDGSMLIFSLFIFIMMMWSTGMAIDFMRHEQQRVKLQGTMDRAVLAAANRRQQSSPEDVIQSYIDTTSFPGIVQVNVSGSAPNGGGNNEMSGRSVRVEARTPVNMMFLNMLGIHQIPAVVVSEASTTARRREISIVLDVSGSMGRSISNPVAGRNTKIEEMKHATKVLVEDLLADGRHELTSINIIPYTGYVNVGRDIASQMTFKPGAQPFSHCVIFEEEDYQTTTVDLVKAYGKHQDRDTSTSSSWWNTRNAFPVERWSQAGNEFKAQLNECPIEKNAVIAYQNDPVKLGEYIDDLRPILWTSTNIGTAWGVKMLDPSFSPAMAALRVKNPTERGFVPPIFSDRPVPYATTDLDKVLIVMTDGVNTKPRKVRDQYYLDLSQQHHFNRFSFLDHSLHYCGRHNNCRGYGRYLYQASSGSDSPGRSETRSENDGDMRDVCTAGKANGISIWTIAFELNDSGAETLLRDCATGDGDDAQFEKATGQELTTVFQKIAATITRLRLTE